MDERMDRQVLWIPRDVKNMMEQTDQRRPRTIPLCNDHTLQKKKRNHKKKNGEHIR